MWRIGSPSKKIVCRREKCFSCAVDKILMESASGIPENNEKRYTDVALWLMVLVISKFCPLPAMGCNIPEIPDCMSFRLDGFKVFVTLMLVS